MNRGIILYREILKLHRKLPKEFRSIGDLYVKNEFGAHKKITNQTQVLEFLYSWTLYKNSLKNQLDHKLEGQHINFEMLNEEQKVQLNELHEEIKKID